QSSSSSWRFERTSSLSLPTSADFSASFCTTQASRKLTITAFLRLLAAGNPLFLHNTLSSAAVSVGRLARSSSM
ncbi:hypothetical protein NDU88_010498, partial [Pleurodeles waltl]